MSTEKTNLKKKVAAGAVLVALSGFVPQITNNRAYADTATINMTGKFTDGITMSFGAHAVYGTIVATNSGGKIVIAPGGALTVTNGFANGGAPAAGRFNWQAAAIQPVDMTVTGLGTGIAVTGGNMTLNLLSVIMTGPFTASQTFKAGTTKAAGVVLKATPVGTTADINVGVHTTWTVRPLGTFTTPIKLVIAY